LFGKHLLVDCKQHVSVILNHLCGGRSKLFSGRPLYDKEFLLSALFELLQFRPAHFDVQLNFIILLRQL
jgi:hypothetical protein